MQLAVVLQASRLLFGRKAGGQKTIAGSDLGGDEMAVSWMLQLKADSKKTGCHWMMAA